jgi:hypothetical protein
VEFVLAPKYLAALISVPCLSIISNFFGILAGGLFMFFSTRLAPLLYVHYVFNSITLRDVITGLIKSVVFATIMTLIRGGDEAGRDPTIERADDTFSIVAQEPDELLLVLRLDGQDVDKSGDLFRHLYGRVHDVLL